MQASSVAERLAGVRNDIEKACAAAGRDSGEVVLVGACKRQPLDRLMEAHRAGLRAFGENIVQEAISHRSELPSGIEWHLIGPLQSNKANKAIQVFSWIHSIDRLKIARVLERVAARENVRLHGLLEVNLGNEQSKHGFRPEDLARELDELADLEHVRIEGLMAIPPFESEEEASRRWFRADLFSRARWAGRAGYLSMGMSGDFAVAIEEGATHIRVGTSLFGARTH